MKKTVTVKQEDVVVKEIKLQEDGTKIDLTLWRDHSSADIQVGQHIEVENVIVKRWNGVNTVNTTSRTVIKVLLITLNRCLN